MKSFQSIQEERGERAFKQAMAMGLKYGGFGYWKDPQTNETVYKTENDTLVKVEPREESELAAKGGPDDGGGRPDAMGGGMAAGGGAGMAGAGGMLQMPGGGQAGAGILGTGEPGAAKVGKEHGWEPGPDGDTCVGPEAEEPGEVPEDSFVGRTNFLKWKAGPDGDNINTVSLGMVKEQIRQIQEGGRTDLGSDYVPPDTGQRAQIQARKDEALRKRPARMKAKNLFDKGIEPPLPLGTTTNRYINKRRKKDSQNPSQYQRGLKWMKDQGLAGGTGSHQHRDNDGNLRTNTTAKTWWKKAHPDRVQTSDYDYDDEPLRDLEDIHRDASQGAIKKDADVVSQMNKSAGALVKDPEYALDQFDESDFMGGGAFGKTYKDKNGNIVKKGQIGPSEIKALAAMKDNPAFPDIINAQFDSPFLHKSSAYNNPQGGRTNERATGVEEYWEPDDQSEWDKQFPSAFGTYAMSQAKGQELFSGIDELDDEMKDKVMRNFWKARGDLHKAGFSHNDMHGGNIFMDPETGEVSIIDLGLAKDNKLSALMEGLGGLDFEEGNDYQLNHHMGGSNFSERMQDMSVKNREKIEETLMDSFDMEDEDTFYPAMQAIKEMMVGDIRMRDGDFDRIKEAIPYLADDENVSKLIKMLYDGIGNSELSDRMGDAFERKQKDTKVLKAANLMRKKRGESQIEPRRDVIPPKNMDFNTSGNVIHDD
jgi:hypothetical protein